MLRLFLIVYLNILSKSKIRCLLVKIYSVIHLIDCFQESISDLWSPQVWHYVDNDCLLFKFISSCNGDGLID
jgi:hypothetical protein